VLDNPVTTGELNVRFCDPVVVAAVARVIVPGVEPIEATVSPAGIPVPVKCSPTFSLAARLNVRLVVPAGPPGLVAVAFWLRVMAEGELIAETVVPVGMPVPETGSPTNRLVVLEKLVTDADPLVVWPPKTVVIPVTVVDPLVSVPGKLRVFSVPVKLTVFSVPVKLRLFSVPVRVVPAPGEVDAGVAPLMKTAAYAGVSVEPIACRKETVREFAKASYTAVTAVGLAEPGFTRSSRPSKLGRSLDLARALRRAFLDGSSSRQKRPIML
jgi:hypothetical protein